MEKERKEGNGKESGEDEFFCSLSDIINAMIDGVAFFNLEGRVNQINKAALKMFGYEKEEAIGKPIIAFFPERMAQRFEEVIKETLVKGFTRNVDFFCLTRDGNDFPVRISTTLLKDAQAQGEPKEIIVIIRDSTEINKLIAELEVSKARSDSIMSSVADIIVTLDNEGRVLTLNPFGKNFVENTLGYRLNEIVGKSYTELTHLVSAEEIERVGDGSERSSRN
jgi:PAS domain S-box-containing protein